MAKLDGSVLAPKTLLDFQQHFASEETCIAYLYGKRFPDGFVCHYCKHHEKDAGPPFTFAGRPTVYRCRYCKRDTSLTAGTIMHRSKQPLHAWFWAAFLVTGLTPGMSAVQLKKMLGIERYETAFNMLHKLRAAMVRPERDPIGQKFPVEVDETFVGGATQGKGTVLQIKCSWSVLLKLCRGASRRNGAVGTQTLWAGHCLRTVEGTGAKFLQAASGCK